MRSAQCQLSGPSRHLPTFGLPSRTLGLLALGATYLVVALTTGCASTTQMADSSSSATRAQSADEPKKDDAKKAQPEDGDSSWKFWDKWFHVDVPPGDAQTLILRGDKLENEKPPPKAAADLAGAYEFYRQGDYEKAEKVFHSVAEKPKAPAAVAEEARFYEAESLRRQGKYPRACDTYHRMLKDFGASVYTELACQRMFDIANFWLKDTRADMEQSEEKKKGTHWPSLTPVLHWESEKPLVDEEGRALETLENIHTSDPRGPLDDKVLFLSGSVRFFREDYREADYNFTQLIETHPNSPLVEKAYKLGIIAKQMSTGGPDYDGRKVAEARILVNKALSNYPKLANDPDCSKFLSDQLASCTKQQAEKDFKMGDYYQRTGHQGSAYFYYEIVRRRYPGTPEAKEATQRMLTIRKEVEEKQAKDKEKAQAADAKKETAAQPAHSTPPSVATPSLETAPSPRTVPPGGFPAQSGALPTVPAPAAPAPVPATFGPGPAAPGAVQPQASPQGTPMEGLPPLPR